VTAQSVQRWATGWMISVLGFNFRRGLGIFLFTTASRTDPGPTQPPIRLVPGALSLGVKLPGCEADHSPPSSAEVNTPSWHGAQLKHRDNIFYLYLYRGGRGLKADNSHPPSAEVKNAWNYTSTPTYVFMAWCLVNKYGICLHDMVVSLVQGQLIFPYFSFFLCMRLERVPTRS
jgi:hypothetical protein